MMLNAEQEKIMATAGVAYTAYCAYAGNKSLVTGTPLPSWNDLPGTIVNAWFAATKAALEFYNK